LFVALITNESYNAVVVRTILEIWFAVVLAEVSIELLLRNQMKVIKKKLGIK
jgi:hypothetical protein